MISQTIFLIIIYKTKLPLSLTDFVCICGSRLLLSVPEEFDSFKCVSKPSDASPSILDSEPEDALSSPSSEEPLCLTTH